MKIRIESPKENMVTLLRRAGYVFQRKDGEEMSFIRPLANSGYPRFHIYSHMEGKSLLINLHLDYKKETYGSATRHHGEYEDSNLLNEEAERIQKMFL